MSGKKEPSALEQAIERMEGGVSKILENQEQMGARLSTLEEGHGTLKSEVDKIRSEHGNAIEVVQTSVKSIEKRSAERTVEIPGLSDEAHKFSLARAVVAIASDDWRNAGFEREVMEEARERALSAGTDSAGGHIVPMQAIPEVIELLRAKSVARMMGVRVLPGLVGSPAPIPKVTGGATAYAVGENKDITASDQSFGEMNLYPHAIAAMTKLSRRLVRMSNPAAETIVRDDISRVLALFEDLMVFKGTGADGQPLGAANQTGVATSTLATIGTNTYSKLVDFAGKLEAANVPLDNPGWVFHPTGKQLLQKQVDSDGRPLFLNALQPAGDGLRPENVLLGYPWGVSTQLATTDAFFANWQDVVLGEWGAIEIMASMETSDAFSKNQLWVRIIKEIDVGVRHPESVVYVSDLAA